MSSQFNINSLNFFKKIPSVNCLTSRSRPNTHQNEPVPDRTIEARLVEFHDFYMFRYRTNFCTRFSNRTCDQAKPYTCHNAHYENHLRRKPVLENDGAWNYSPNLCSFASILDCPDGRLCPLSHRAQKENIYHPLVYKTTFCDMAVNSQGECTEYGRNCSKAHGDLDLRTPHSTHLPQFRASSPLPDVNNYSMLPLVPSSSRTPDISSTITNMARLQFDHFIPPQKELEAHEKYMYEFRTRTCLLYLASIDPSQKNNQGGDSSPAQSSCPCDVYSCFDCHSRTPRRRKPQLQNGRFNYIPTRCRYILEEQECPQGVHCRFAHGTEEVIYHPSKYKTQLCSSSVDDNGHCTSFGPHCAKAHGPRDRRNPVFEESEEGPRVQDPSQFVCPKSQRDEERKFYMYHYKTKKCVGFPWNCQCNGMDYHRPQESRRGPKIEYAPVACTNVKPFSNSEWVSPEVCPKGDQCEFAHTLLELMYHPLVYKTGLCDHFDENNACLWKCVWKRRCAHAHGRDDMRPKPEKIEFFNYPPPPSTTRPSVASIMSPIRLNSPRDFSTTPNMIEYNGLPIGPGTVHQTSESRWSSPPLSNHGAVAQKPNLQPQQAGPPASQQEMDSDSSEWFPGFGSFGFTKCLPKGGFPGFSLALNLNSSNKAPEPVPPRSSSSAIDPWRDPPVPQPEDQFSFPVQDDTLLGSVPTSPQSLLGPPSDLEVKDAQGDRHGEADKMVIGTLRIFNDQKVDIAGCQLRRGELADGSSVLVELLDRPTTLGVTHIRASLHRLLEMGRSADHYFISPVLDLTCDANTVYVSRLEYPEGDLMTVTKAFQESMDPLESCGDEIGCHDHVASDEVKSTCSSDEKCLEEEDQNYGLGERLEDLEPLRIIKQLFTALDYLHQNGMSHNCLSPSCIHFTENRSQIRISNAITGTPSPTWQAPELENKTDSKVEQTFMRPESDIFSAGCITYYILSGVHPFDPTGSIFVGEEQQSDRILSKMRSGISPSLDALNPIEKDLVQNTLNIKPDFRLSALDVLAHPYFWTDAHRLNLLRCVTDFINSNFKLNNSTNPSTDLATDKIESFLSALESYAPMVFKANGRTSSWKHMIDSQLYKYEFESAEKPNPKKISSLLQLIRNCILEWNDLSPEIRRIFAPYTSPDSSVDSVKAISSYFFSKFPNLFIVVYNLVKQHGDLVRHRVFRQFFTRCRVLSDQSDAVSLSNNEVCNLTSCPLGTDKHMLAEPVPTRCCGISFCRVCLPELLLRVSQTKRCGLGCGHETSVDIERQYFESTPTNKSLASLLSLISNSFSAPSLRRYFSN